MRTEAGKDEGTGRFGASSRADAALPPPATHHADGASATWRPALGRCTCREAAARLGFVVDSSVALSWCFEDERTPATRALLERVGEAGAMVPQHWPAEVLNGLMMAERRQRIDADRRRKLADFLHDLPLAIDPETTVQLWGPSRLADAFAASHGRLFVSGTGRGARS